MPTTVKVIFPVEATDVPKWPHIGYDAEKRATAVTATLREALPEMVFLPALCHSQAEAQEALQGEPADGYLVYLASMWTGIAELCVRQACPVVVADDLYCGSGSLLRVHSLIRREHLPALSVASSDFQDVIDAVRLFDVMRRLREARILVVADGRSWGAREEIVRATANLFGTKVVPIDGDQLRSFYEAVDPAAIAAWSERWIAEAQATIEPSQEDVELSARMYLALKAAMEANGADAVTVDCLGMFYTGRLPAYPCLSHFQMNNDGLTGVCEGDVESTLTQLLFRYLAGVPGYVSDPVIDTASGQIIYAHCVATNRVFGADGLANPYTVRSHAEDLKGAAVQSFMPLGRTVTTAKVSVCNRCLAVHTGKTVANIVDEKACRTKLAVEADVRRILDNYHFEIFSWHRVTAYGDYRKPLIDLATLYGLEVHEEDR